MNEPEKNLRASKYPNLKLQLWDSAAQKPLVIYNIKTPKDKYSKMALWKYSKKGIEGYKLSFVAVYNGIEYYANIGLKPLSSTPRYKPKEDKKGESDISK